MASEGGQDNKQHCNSSVAKAYQDRDTHTKRTSFTAERPRQGTRHGRSSQPVALAHQGQGQQVLGFLMLLGRTPGMNSALQINAKPKQLHVKLAQERADHQVLAETTESSGGRILIPKAVSVSSGQPF